MKFKCKLSGCVTEFLLEHDIEAMLDHPQYERVKEEDVTNTEEIILEKRARRAKKVAE